MDPEHDWKKLCGLDGKKLLGQAGAIVCRIGPTEDIDHLLVCEGVETGCALLESTGSCVFCCISTDGLEKIDLSHLPHVPSCVTVCADNDAWSKKAKNYPGEYSARIACEKLNLIVQDVRIAMPPVPRDVELARDAPRGVKSIDWLDIFVLPEFGCTEVRELINAAENSRAYRWRVPAENNQGAGGSEWRMWTRVTETGHVQLNSDPNDHADAYLEHRFRDDAGRLKIRYWQEEWFGFNGKCYTPLAKEFVSTDLRKWLSRCAMRKLKKKGDDPAIAENWETVRIRPTQRMANDVMHAVMGRCMAGGGLDGQLELYTWTGERESDGDLRIAAIDGLITPENVLSLQDGLLDADAWCRGELRTVRHTPEWFSRTCLPFSIPSWATPGSDQAAWDRAPMYHRFVSSLFDEDPQDGRDEFVSQIETFHEWGGYLLTPDTSMQRIACVRGLPGAGKGTQNRLMYFMLGGHEQVATTNLNDLGDTFGREVLIGKQAAVIPDCENVFGRTAGASKEYLKMISGEDPVPVRRKHVKDLPSVRLKVRFTIFMNDMLRLTDESRALERRFLWFATPNVIRPEDRVPDLYEKLCTEAGAIAVLWLNALARLRSRGRFLQPTGGMDLAREFSLQSSRVRPFVSECCALGPDLSIEKDVIYSYYIKWCEDMGDRKPLAKNEFGKKLLGCGLGITSHMVSREHVYASIRMTEEAMVRLNHASDAGDARSLQY